MPNVCRLDPTTLVTCAWSLQSCCVHAYWQTRGAAVHDCDAWILACVQQTCTCVSVPDCASIAAPVPPALAEAVSYSSLFSGRSEKALGVSGAPGVGRAALSRPRTETHRTGVSITTRIISLKPRPTSVSMKTDLLLCLPVRLRSWFGYETHRAQGYCVSVIAWRSLRTASGVLYS
jgi:hypothetical protein